MPRPRLELNDVILRRRSLRARNIPPPIAFVCWRAFLAPSPGAPICPARAALPRTHARGSFLWARNRATLAYRRRRERGSCGAI